MFFPLNVSFLRTVREKSERGEVLESLEYDAFLSGILRVTPTVNNNGSLLKFEEITLTKMKTEPVVSKRRTQIKVESKSFH